MHYENDIDAMGDSFGSQIPNIGGQRKHWNQVTVDGLNGNELSGTNRMNSSINLDAIAEVKVLLNTYKAEFGHSGRRQHRDRQQERQRRLSRQRRTGTAGATPGTRSPWENNRAGVAEAEAAHRHARIQSRRPGEDSRASTIRAATRSCSSSTRSRRRRCRSPGQVRLYRMPTALERQGDFSQTFDANGRLMFIKDPLVDCACSVTTGGAGCFPGNIIPANRLDPNALALLNLLPLPNVADQPGTGANYNFTRQETPDNPRLNNLLRIDGRPSGNNSYWASVPARSARTSTDRRSPPARRSGASSTATYVSGDSGINGGWNHVVDVEPGERVRRRHPARDRRLRHQGRQRPTRSHAKRRRLHARRSSIRS